MTSLQVPDEEFTLETREASPAHCLTRIKSFSLLSKHGISKIESMEFDAGEYKWKLIIYPDGDDKVKKADYMSVHLSMVGTASLPAGWEFNAFANIFVYNHISDNYICFRGKVRRFHAINFEWKMSKLMAKTCFTEPSNGYLFEDNCVFGAEVFVIKNQGVIGNVSVLALADPFKCEWKITDFSKQQNIWTAPDFIAGGYKWKVKLYPKGLLEAKGRFISIFLEYIDSLSFAVHKKVKATCQFFIRNMLQNQNNHTGKVTHWFTSKESDWGFHKFIAIGDVSKGFLVDDCCVVGIHLYVEAVLEAPKWSNVTCNQMIN